MAKTFKQYLKDFLDERTTPLSEPKDLATKKAENIKFWTDHLKKVKKMEDSRYKKIAEKEATDRLSFWKKVDLN